MTLISSNQNGLRRYQFRVLVLGGNGSGEFERPVRLPVGPKCATEASAGIATCTGAIAIVDTWGHAISQSGMLSPLPEQSWQLSIAMSAIDIPTSITAALTVERLVPAAKAAIKSMVRNLMQFSIVNFYPKGGNLSTQNSCDHAAVIQKVSRCRREM